MADPFIGEIGIFAFNFAPKGWSLCNGQVMDIRQNAALYSLLGVQFGGDGVNNFKLPDMRGRTPVHPNPNDGRVYNQGIFGGLEQVVLNVNQMPAHIHQVSAQSSDSNADSPSGAFLSGVKSVSGSTSYSKDPTPIYTSSPNNLVALDTRTIGKTGGGQAHFNMQPSLVLNFCISLVGTYPSRD